MIYLFDYSSVSQGDAQLLAHVELYLPVWLDLDKLPQVVRDDLLEDGASLPGVRVNGPHPSVLKKTISRQIKKK